MGGRLGFEFPPISSTTRPMTNDTFILDEFRKASEGRLYMSESDYPFEMIQWDGSTALTDDFLCEVSDMTVGSAVERLDIDQFLTGPFVRLAELIKKYLSDVRVYRIGTINMPVFIVGRSPEGNWLGVSTRIVQT